MKSLQPKPDKVEFHLNDKGLMVATMAGLIIVLLGFFKLVVELKLIQKKYPK